MKVALVHDWLVAARGGEHVLLELCRMFPDAQVFTLVHDPGSTHAEIEAHPIHTSFVQQLPGAPRRFRQYLPLFPRAIESFDLRGFDLVISTSHCVAKGVRTTRAQRHVSYIHTPMRYVWDQRQHYSPRWLPVAGYDRMLAPLRRWDVASAVRPDSLMANSGFVARRIAKVWGRTAEVVYPPVDIEYFSAPSAMTERHGYVVAGALVRYKRVDLAVQFATRHSIALQVIGDGPERRRLQDMAGPSVHFRGAVDRMQLRTVFRRARALLMCGVEDFGITPVEAMAAGCPVIAYAEGGAVETVVDDGESSTGVLFTSASVESLLDVHRQFEQRRQRRDFDPAVMRKHVRKFDAHRFAQRVRLVLDAEAPAP